MPDTPAAPPKQEVKPNPEADLAKRVQDLEAALVAQRAAMPMSLVPLHGAGEGEEVAETWSQYDQERSRAEA